MYKCNFYSARCKNIGLTSDSLLLLTTTQDFSNNRGWDFQGCGCFDQQRRNRWLNWTSQIHLCRFLAFNIIFWLFFFCLYLIGQGRFLTHKWEESKRPSNPGCSKGSAKLLPLQNICNVMIWIIWLIKFSILSVDCPQNNGWQHDGCVHLLFAVCGIKTSVNMYTHLFM